MKHCRRHPSPNALSSTANGIAWHMKVELLYIPHCPNYPPTLETVREVLHESGLPLEIAEIEITSSVQAAQFAFPGSPTVRVDGKDVEPSTRGPMSYGLICRSYDVNGKRQGVPDPEWIRRAIRDVRTKAPQVLQQ